MDDHSEPCEPAERVSAGGVGRAHAPTAGREATRQRIAVVITAELTAVWAVGFIVLAVAVASSPQAPAWDRSLLSALEAVRTPTLTAVFQAVTVAGEGWTVSALTIVAIAAVLLRGKRAYATQFAVTMSAGWLVEYLVKNLFHRGRLPASEALIIPPTSYSFPSGHAFVSLVLCALLVYVGFRLVRSCATRSALTAAALVLVLMVGVSRVYLGVHWPSDVLASWFLAAAWLSLCLGGFTVWRWRRPGTREAEHTAA